MTVWEARLASARTCLLTSLRRGERGQDIVEYAFLAGLISIVAVGVIVLLGPYLQNAFQDLINAVNSA
jgi:pilus assembly protein Flp/PilA